ncbi:hypothetical protein QQF64_034098 [Cirrhinus molitorella]|uniref:Uncharacterized protein n=1 Tax=Cirrhinus molitorella TaxID=172907 RepID=A0ABR3MW14_9TELE
MLVFADSEITLEREKRSTANEEQRASSDSEAEAELQHSTSSSCLALDTQVKPKPSHNAAAVDTSDGGAEEHQTDKPVTDGSRSNDLSTERSSEIDSSTATDVNFTWPNAGASVFGSAATQNEAEETRNEAEEEGSNEVKPKSSHDAAAVDMSDGGAEEHQTDTPAAERSSESNSSTATGWNLFADLARGSGEFTFGKKDVNFTWPNAGAPALRSAATQNESEETCNEGKGSAEVHQNDDPL